jgi:hypothetical protein
MFNRLFVPEGKQVGWTADVCATCVTVLFPLMASIASFAFGLGG